MFKIKKMPAPQTTI